MNTSKRTPGLPGLELAYSGAMVRVIREPRPRLGDRVMPVDRIRHGGYGVKRRGTDGRIGPFVWYENAARVAGQVDGIVLRWRDLRHEASNRRP